MQTSAAFACDWEAEINPATCTQLPSEENIIVVDGNPERMETRNCLVNGDRVSYEYRSNSPRWASKEQPVFTHYANKPKNDGIVKIWDTNRDCEGVYLRVHQYITKWYCEHLMNKKCSRGQIVNIR